MSARDLLNLFNQEVAPLGSFGSPNPFINKTFTRKQIAESYVDPQSPFFRADFVNPAGGGVAFNQSMGTEKDRTGYNPTAFLSEEAASPYLAVGAEGAANFKPAARDFMVEFGGGTVLSEEQIAQLSPTDLEAYNKSRKTARNKGTAEILNVLSDILSGESAAVGAANRRQSEMLLAQEQERIGNVQKQKQSAYNLLIKNGYSPAEAMAMANDPSTAQAAISGALSNQFDLPSAVRTANYQVKLANPNLDPNSNEYKQLVSEKINENLKNASGIDLEGEKELEITKALVNLDVNRLGDMDESINTYREFSPRLNNMKNIVVSAIQKGESITGPISEITLEWKKIIEDATGTKFANLPKQEALTAASSYLVPRMRAVGSGATSDFEASLYQAAAPSLGKTEEGNLVIANTMINTGERDINYKDLRERYFAVNRTLAGFDAAYNKSLDDAKARGESTEDGQINNSYAATMNIGGVNYPVKRVFEIYDIADFGIDEANGNTRLENLVQTGMLRDGQTIALRNENGGYDLVNFFAGNFEKVEEEEETETQ